MYVIVSLYNHIYISAHTCIHIYIIYIYYMCIHTRVYIYIGIYI